MALFLFGVLLVGLLNHAWATNSAKPTRTSTRPTRTFCPRYYVTPVLPSPKGRVCGGPGSLSKPDLLNVYCGLGLNGLGTRSLNLTEEQVCYRACVADPNCVSFSVDPAHNDCSTYGKPVADMGYVRDENRYLFFWDLRACYKCNQPAPPKRSACPTNAKPKTRPPRKFTCGQNGTIPDPSKAIYSEAGYPSTPEGCYTICTYDYEPVGVCDSFALYQPADPRQLATCYIFDGSLRKQGFKRNDTGAWRGWNLRGCFECDDPPAPVETCKYPHQPVYVGVSNGNFQRIYYSQDYSRVLPEFWYFAYRQGTVETVNGNNFISLPGGPGNDPANTDSNIATGIFGLSHDPNSPNRFYNFSFDLAIPYHYDPDPDDFRTGCALRYPGYSYTSDTYIAGSDLRFQGTQLKTFGPYLVDYSQFPGDREERFAVTCRRSNDPVGPKVTFWIDNFRITQNGRNIGGP